MKKINGIILLLLILSLSGCSIGESDSVTLTGEEYQQYLEDKERITKVDYLVESIKENYLYEDELSEEDLENGLYKGLFMALDDPYSVYYNDSEFEKLTEDNQGEFGGVGIQITAEPDGYITIIAPIAETPGDRAGLQAGDKIIAINDEPYYGTDLEEAVDVMRGEPGTDVTITVRRETDEGYEDKDFTITREIIKVESVYQEAMDNILYIRLSSFDENTAGDFKQALDDGKDNYQGIILDLRNNPGGLLSSVVEIADTLLPAGTIVSTVDNQDNERIEESDASMVDIPIVVLVNEGSASASEILAGALQDYERAPIVGQTTFGKGVVQKIFALDEGGYKITVSEYYTPAGDKIHGQGVTPDVEIELSEDAEGMGPEFLEEDNQLQKALEIINEEN